MQRIGESRWRPLELCWWPEQGKLPAKGKEYPSLGYKRLRDKPPKTQPAVAHSSQEQQVGGAWSVSLDFRGMAPHSGLSKAKAATPPTQTRWLTLAAGLVAGYILGMVIMETADVMYTSKVEHAMHAATPAEGLHGAPPLASSTPATMALSPLQAAPAPAKPQPVSRQLDIKPAGDTIHSLLTSNGSPYQGFQTRIMYGTYKLVQAMPGTMPHKRPWDSRHHRCCIILVLALALLLLADAGGEKLTGFTRVMHRTTDDFLMDEVPTFRAQPLHPKCDEYCDFPVADRANAVVQWIQAVKKDPNMLQGAWVLLLESDYVWMKPVRAPDAASSAPGFQYHYDYIQAEHPNAAPHIKKLFGSSAPAPVPNSGPAPALLRFSELEVVAPEWERVTALIEEDKAAVDALGWVREMYAWDVALALHPDVKMLTQEPYESVLLVQPPHEDHLGNASMCHYTWGAIYNDSSSTVWRWEKRDYTALKDALKVPHLAMPPEPFKPNTWHLQAHEPVTEQLHATLTAMIAQMNRAIDLLPDLTKVKTARRMRLLFPCSGQKHSSSGRHLLSPMRCMFNAALQSLSSHLPGCGDGLALAALPLVLPLGGSAAGLLRLAGGGVLGPGSEAAGCEASWLLRGACGGLRGATTGHHIRPRTGCFHGKPKLLEKATIRRTAHRVMAKKKRKGSDKKHKASRSAQGKQRQARRDSWNTTRRQVIKVPEGAVLRGCKKTRRKLREHLRLRAEIHSQLRFIASLFVLRMFLTCLPPAVQPPQPPDAPPLPPLPPRAPAQPAPAQPASMEFDTDSDSESDCDSDPEPQSDSESESEPEPVMQPPQRRCSARLAAIAPTTPTGPPLPLDCEDPVMLRQLKDFCKFFANPNFKTCYNQLQRRLDPSNLALLAKLQEMGNINLAGFHNTIDAHSMQLASSELKAATLDKGHVADLIEEANKHRRLLGMKKQGSLHDTLPLPCRMRHAVQVCRWLERWQQPHTPPAPGQPKRGKRRGVGPRTLTCPPPFTLTPMARVGVHFIKVDSRVLHGVCRQLGLIKETRAAFTSEPALSQHKARWFNTRKLRNQGFAFERLVDTDGVSVCVHYTRPLPPPPAPPPAASSSNTSSRPSAAAAAAHAPGLPHIGRGIAEMREFVFDPDTQIGVGIDPGVTQAVSAASGVWDPATGQLMADQLRRWKLTKGEVKHASGLNNARRDTKRWLAPIKPHLQHLAAASSAGTSLEANLKHITVTLATWDAVWEVYLDPKWARQRLRLYGAQDRALEQFFNKLEEDMAELSMKRHNHAKQLVVFFGAATIGTGGGWGADAVLRACRKVVCRPRGPDQDGGRVVLVDEHRTSRVSSAVNGKQPCEVELNTLTKRSKPAAEPPKGKGKGKAAKAKSAPQPGRWLDRDCNAALNMQRIGESMWRPLELCYWPDQGALPAKGKEYPGLGYKRLRDKPPKAQEQQQQPAVAQIIDSIIFNDELELLDIRLHTLWDVVDTFVIVESNKTFSNKSKPLHFAENAARYTEFMRKIHHFVMVDPPHLHPGPWEREHVHRRAQANRNESLKGVPLSTGDLVLMSDVDEVADPALLAALKSCQGVDVELFCLDLRFSLYSCKCELDQFHSKLSSYSHMEFDTPANRYPATLINRIVNGLDIAGRASEKFERETVVGIDYEHHVAPHEHHVTNLNVRLVPAPLLLLLPLLKISHTGFHGKPKLLEKATARRIAHRVMAKKKRKGSDKKHKGDGHAFCVPALFVSTPPCVLACQNGNLAWLQVIKVPEGAVLRGCKKTRRKLREHLRLRAEIHSQLRVIASLFVLRIFLTCLVGYPTSGFRSAPTPTAVQPPLAPDAASLPPLPPRAPAQPAPAQPASMECDNDSDSESDCDSDPEPQSDTESESEPEPVTQPPQRRCSARLAALAPAAPTGPPLPLDCEDPVMLRQLKDFCKFFANPNFKTCYNQLQRRLVRDRHPMLMPAFGDPNNQALLAKLQELCSINLAGDANTLDAHSMQLAGKGKAAKAKPAPQPGRWLDRDCNAALNMQRIGESMWRPLELCYWPDQGALPAKGKEYPGLGYKRLRDKPPKAQEQQQQPAVAQSVQASWSAQFQLAAIELIGGEFTLSPDMVLGTKAMGVKWLE
ncbi:hypothetical protein QJQ45_014533, partial [Haematococcus lacustris]